MCVVAARPHHLITSAIRCRTDTGPELAPGARPLLHHLHQHPTSDRSELSSSVTVFSIATLLTLLSTFTVHSRISIFSFCQQYQPRNMELCTFLGFFAVIQRREVYGSCGEVDGRPQLLHSRTYSLGDERGSRYPERGWCLIVTIR